ncbi:hypothetical protein G4O51_00675 [Candidatus Bathyarchaeota archaeon A05DMB-2]|nr:hypothetical protein [Candidatus Bathyarchaeota archaeon A05DMB-2]
MRKKLVLGTILTLSLLIVSVVVAVAPVIAGPKDNSIDLYGTGARVGLALPPPGVGPPPAGVAAHPTDLNIAVWDYDRRSETGAHDFMQIQVWVPAINAYLPIALVMDIPVPEWLKKEWNHTSMGYYYEANGVVRHSNMFSVADKELEVWTESSYYGGGRKLCDYKSADTIYANLTKPLFINYTSPNPSIGNLSFTLPPMTMRFIKIAEGWYTEVVSTPNNWVFAIKEIQTPAWVEVTIPSWIKLAGIETTGHLSLHGSVSNTPPAS